MGQVLSIILRLLRRSNDGSKGKDQTPTATDHDQAKQLRLPLQQKSGSETESHYLTIFDPPLAPSGSTTSSNDTDHDKDTIIVPCMDMVLDLSSRVDEDDAENKAKNDSAASAVLEEVIIVIEKKPSKEKLKEVSTNIIANGVSTTGKKEVGRIGPYTSTHKILLVGEGDFSFSASLAAAFGCASNMVATSLNTKEFLLKNYGKFSTNNIELVTRGCLVLHGVDATKMTKHPQLRTKKFDRIVYNFPHSGFRSKESLESEFCRHQKLVRGFLRNAKKMIEDDGEIHVTHKSNGFFLKWDIPKLGSDQGLCLLQEVKFKRSKYPEYHPKYGFGGDKDFDCNPSKTYKFGLANPNHTA